MPAPYEGCLCPVCEAVREEMRAAERAEVERRRAATEAGTRIPPPPRQDAPRPAPVRTRCPVCQQGAVYGIEEPPHVIFEGQWSVYLAYGIMCRHLHCHYEDCRRLILSTETKCKGCGGCGACCHCVPCRRCLGKFDPGMLCARCHYCQGGCCTCFQCTRCHAMANRVCETCRVCRNCCHCAHCAQCDHVVRRICNECRSCPDCCRCPSDDGEVTNRKGAGKVRWIENPLIFHIASKTEFKKNPSKRFISAEIEVASVEGYGPIVEDVVMKWMASVVHDGSLPRTGFEINTAPASGDRYVNEIEEICEALKKAEARVTAACGLHVHVDARDCSYYDMRRLVEVYARIEPALFLMVSPNRRESRFCMPCGEKLLQAVKEGKLPYKVMKQAVLNSVYGEGNPEAAATREGKKLRRKKYVDARYAALNLHSWLYRGTVESRIFGGTIRADKIIAWGRLWATIMDFVVARTDDEVRVAFEGIEKGSPGSLACLRCIVSGDEDLQKFITARVEKFAAPAALVAVPGEKEKSRTISAAEL